MEEIKFSYYSYEFDLDLLVSLCAANYNVHPKQLILMQEEYYVYDVRVISYIPIKLNQGYPAPVITTNTTVGDTYKVRDEKFVQKIQARCSHIDKVDIIPIQNGTFIMFSILCQIYQHMIQTHLNAKHGESSNRQTSLIFDERKELQCCIVVPHDEVVPATWTLLQTMCLDDKLYKFYFFKTTHRDDILELAEHKIWFMNFRREFDSEEQYVTNFCRFFYWQYTGKLLVANDTLYFGLFILARNSWLFNKSLNRNAIKKKFNNPIQSLVSGGFLEDLRRTTNFTDINSGLVRKSAIVNRMLKRPLLMGAGHESCRIIATDNAGLSAPREK